MTNLAVHDALTGLFNRRSLDEALYTLCRDHADRRVACMTVDIGHFKRFNDQFGHDAGDEVMRHVTQIMSGAVGVSGSAYRFGGEEFTVLTTDIADDDALLLAEGLRTAVSAAAFSHHGRIVGPVSISVGVASSSVSGSANTLINRDGGAFLEAKMAGRNMTVAAFSGVADALFEERVGLGTVPAERNSHPLPNPFLFGSRNDRKCTRGSRDPRQWQAGD